MLLPKLHAFKAKLTILSVFVILLSLFIQQSCKKTDIPQTEKITQQVDPAIKFFTLPTNVNPTVKKIADKIKLQNEQKHFLNHFVKRQGYPLWDKALIKENMHPTNLSGKNNGSANLEGDDEELITIPLVLQDSQQVHGALYCRVRGDSISIQLLDGSKYDWYNVHADSIGINGEQVTLLLMLLDKNSFNHSLYRVKDSMAFGLQVNRQSRYIKIIGSNDSGNNVVNSLGHWEYYNTTVDYVTYEPDICGCNGEPCPDGSMHSVYHSENIAGSIWVDDEWYGGGGSGGGGGGGGGNGGGGGYNYGDEFDPLEDLPIDPNPIVEDFGLAQFMILGFNSTQVTNPCITSVINAIGQPGAQSLLLKQYQGLFSAPKVDKFKITFVQNDLLTGNSGNPVASHTDVINSADGTKEIIISINPTYLQSASKEYVATVILHELVHAFYIIQFGNIDQLLQHWSILNGGVNNIKESLHELFPSLSPIDYSSLSLQGLDDIALDPTPDTNGNYNYLNDMDQRAATKVGISFTDARPYAMQYFNGTKGTHC